MCDCAALESSEALNELACADVACLACVWERRQTTRDLACMSSVREISFIVGTLLLRER